MPVRRAVFFGTVGSSFEDLVQHTPLGRSARTKSIHFRMRNNELTELQMLRITPASMKESVFRRDVASAWDPDVQAAPVQHQSDVEVDFRRLFTSDMYTSKSVIPHLSQSSSRPMYWSADQPRMTTSSLQPRRQEFLSNRSA